MKLTSRYAVLHFLDLYLDDIFAQNDFLLFHLQRRE